MRREGQRHAQPRVAADARRSASRRRTPPTSARSQRDSFEADWTACDMSTGSRARERGQGADAHHALRGAGAVGGRLDHADLLAPGHRHRAHRRPGREGPASDAGVDDPADGRRGGARALSAGRLLAPAAAGARGPRADRVRLVVPGRAGRGRGPADREDQGDRLRPEGAALHARVRARRHGNDDAWRRSTRTGTRSTSPSTSRSTAGRSRRCARCTSPSSTTTWRASPCARRAPRAGARTASWPSRAARATDVWAGRTAVSRHNTSSPDMVVSRFKAEAGKPAGK